MTLVLLCISLNEEPMSQPLVGRFDERGGTVGRSDSATFTLPDPERMISRVQARIVNADDSYWIENVSAASPILHNERPLSVGMRVVLREGDEIRIGGYVLQAAYEDDETSATVLRGRTGKTHEGGKAEPRITPPPAERPASSALSARSDPAPARTPPGPPSPARIGAGAGAGAPAQAAGGERLWRAFLEGAGIDSPLPASPSPELFAAIGTMMRIAVGGIHRLVEMRAIAKDEMQAQMTVVQVRENNPLKFAPDGQVALQLLLQPPVRGFLEGPEALRDALVDLQSHQVGVMSGMRAALEQVFDRFDPAKVEALLPAESVFDSLRPAHRRARLWDVYLEHYRSLRAEAQGDFRRLFGEAFLETYEAQVRSLEAGQDAASKGGSPVGGSSK